MTLSFLKSWRTPPLTVVPLTTFPLITSDISGPFNCLSGIPDTFTSSADAPSGNRIEQDNATKCFLRFFMSISNDRSSTKLESELHQRPNLTPPDDAQREVDSNFAGFLEFPTYNLAALIDSSHCFFDAFSETVGPHTVLNILSNPAKN